MRIWEIIIFSHGSSPAPGHTSSAGHCWSLQEIFPKSLLQPLPWDLVKHSHTAQGLQGRAMAGWCPARRYQQRWVELTWSTAPQFLAYWLTVPGDSVRAGGSSRKVSGRELTQHRWLWLSPALRQHQPGTRLGSTWVLPRGP